MKSLPRPSDRRQRKKRRPLGRHIRVELLRQLAPPASGHPRSGPCAECGIVVAHSRLIVDHVDGRDYAVNELYSGPRAKKYAAELASGVRLRALCVTCSCADGGRRRWAKARAA